MFLGTHTPRLDDKGRLFLPAKFREQLAGGLVVTRGPHKSRQNLGIYRQQVIGSNKLIMRWLAHRGGALDFKEWQQKYPDKPFPVAVALGADPATILAAVTPVPDYCPNMPSPACCAAARPKSPNA